MSHSIVHVEIPATHPATSSKFYADLFDWKIEVAPDFDNYHMFQAESGPAGGFVTPGGEMDNKVGEVVIYVSTDDIDATLAKAEALGGKMLIPKGEIPGVGWLAFFADPAGNRIGLFTSDHPQS